MTIRRDNKLYTFLRLFILNFIAFSAINIVILALKNLFTIQLFKNYELYSFTSLILISLLLSLMTLAQYKCITKAVRTDDRLKDKHKLIEVMERMKWRVVSEDEKKIVFKSKFLWGLLDEKIQVDFMDTELHIFGPKDYIKKLIFLAHFDYRETTS